MGNTALVIAEAARVIGPYATCFVVAVAAITLVVIVWLASRVVDNVVADATDAQIKCGQVEVTFRKGRTRK